MYRIFLEPYCLSIKRPDDIQPGKRCINTDISDLPLSRIFSEWAEDPDRSDLTLATTDPNACFQGLRSLFIQIEAAGGLVENPHREILMIYRLGKWDLPKGKLDDGETIITAAVREVEEECGISGLSITASLPKTSHIYQDNNGRWILKTTHWFRMNSLKWEHPIPQEKEHIEEVKWVRRENVAALLNQSYRAIRCLLSNYLTEQSR
jgi:8-oxo-dGTP pyrophosphatase MutT (NUDIX family)